MVISILGGMRLILCVVATLCHGMNVTYLCIPMHTCVFLCIPMYSCVYLCIPLKINDEQIRTRAGEYTKPDIVHIYISKCLRWLADESAAVMTYQWRVLLLVWVSATLLHPIRGYFLFKFWPSSQQAHTIAHSYKPSGPERNLP